MFPGARKTSEINNQLILGEPPVCRPKQDTIRHTMQSLGSRANDGASIEFNPGSKIGINSYKVVRDQAVRFFFFFQIYFLLVGFSLDEDICRLSLPLCVFLVSLH